VGATLRWALRLRRVCFFGPDTVGFEGSATVMDESRACRTATRALRSACASMCGRGRAGCAGAATTGRTCAQSDDWPGQGAAVPAGV